MTKIFSIYSFKNIAAAIVTAIIVFSSCKKDGFITSADAILRTSEDTLHFDTVFTSLGSTTQYLKIFNANDSKLKLTSVTLMGGTNSFFKLNVDGLPGTSFSNIDLEANDSLYMFATVRIDPNAANLPFLVRDSIKIEFNGNTKWIQLQAYGKNARFMNNVVVTQDSAFTNDKPIVILGSLVVNQNKKLTIQKGTQIYIHPNAPIIINGTLNAIGDTAQNEKIVFQGIRIDEPYRDYPGSWPGIYFMENSKDNLLQHCIIKNSYQGVIAFSPSINSLPKLTLNECIFDNIYDVAIGGTNTNIKGRNCLVSNVGYGLYALSGGNYSFDHCTFVSISNYYLSHKKPLITLSNTNENDVTYNPLNATINNSIVYGEGGFVDDEVVTARKASTPFTVSMTNILYKHKTVPADITFNNVITTTNPEFNSIDYSKRIFDFTLKNISPCVDEAIGSTLSFDLKGQPRNVGAAPDLGCYEKQ
ncbi:MAG: choice-of-anchor Q domain-containing protein [Chitinophagaceae bacterium]